ncbi:F-box only protein 9-like [Ylistrum balloti]|uniref:F-box only protein 9-like n=1 Tax=Ylistrum balloti TaxID=509963 RepID=UPI002905BD3F|nr:F-box only protein 9-like [Ylistrum balloti]
MDGDLLQLPMVDGDEACDVPEEPPDIESQLDTFRESWQNEIQQQAKDLKLKEGTSRVSPDTEEHAKVLFLNGMQAEQSGSLYEAISFYRRAMHLVPDIEMRIDYTSLYRPTRVRQESESSVGSADFDDSEDDLVSHLQRIRIQNDDSAICLPEYEQRASHISCLPIEVLILVFKWTITNDLDMKSLENLSEVCRGFYLCARDEEIWRLICLRLWGVNCRNCKKFGSWRMMYIERPHLLFHGLMLMHTSSDEPMVMLTKLRSKQAREQGLLKGYYRVLGDRVTGVLKRVKSGKESGAYMKHSRHREQMRNMHSNEQTYHVEFEITHTGKRKHCRLNWLQYSVHIRYKINESETVSEFELNNKSYPPLLFSRVKSYNAIFEPLK